MKSTLAAAVCTVALLYATQATVKADSVLIDVEGGQSTQLTPDSLGRYWNSTGSIGSTPGYTVTDAVDKGNTPTGIDLNVLDRFNGTNIQGTTSSVLTDWDSAVTSDSWWVGDADKSAQFRLEDLAAGGIYDLVFYGSRNSGDTRSIDVTAGGITTSYNAGNPEGLGKLKSLQADASGQITVDFSTATYGYLGGIEIVSDPVPPTVFIDFNGGNAPAPDSKGRYWNGTSGGFSGTIVTDAVDRYNSGTRIDINVTDAFQGANNAGTTASAITDWDAAVTGDSHWIGDANKNGQINIEDLNPGARYDLVFYGSRNSGDTRVMDVSAGGMTRSYNAGNPEGLAGFRSVEADAGGQITIDFSTLNYGYLGGMELAPALHPPTVYIDFDGGDAPTPDSKGRYWNGTSGGFVGTIVTDAVDESNYGTTIDINVIDDFYSNNGQGTTASSLTDWDAAVTEDSFWLDRLQGNSHAEIRIEDLIAGESYALTFYGSRNSGDDRVMDVTIGNLIQSYNAGNPEGLTTFQGVLADINGNITVSFDVAPGLPWAYLGAMKITSYVPEPSSLALMGFVALASGAVGSRRRRRG